MFNQNPMACMNGFNRPQYPQYGNQFVPSTNKQFVRSLEEALSLPADFNSQNVFFDANENLVYDICTNGRGEKSWSIFEVSLKQSSNMVTQSVSSDYDNRLKNIETKLEELLNGKHNVEQADASGK